MTSTDVLDDYRKLIPEETEVIVEIVRQAEERMRMQVQMALAADARAVWIATLQGAGSIALLVAAMEKLSAGSRAVVVLAAGCLAVATFCAAVAAFPIAFGMIGTLPSDWVDAVQDREPLSQSLAGYAVWLDKYLKFNAKQMANNNNWLRCSIVISVLAPVVAFAAALVFL